MDRLFTLVVNAGNGPPIRDGVDASTRPSIAGLPVSGRAEPGPAEAAPSTRPLRRACVGHDPTDDAGAPGAGRHPERRVARASVALRRDVHPAAHRRSRCRASPRPAAPPAGRDRPYVGRARARRLAHGRLHLPRAACTRRAAGVAGQLRAGVPPGHGRARRPARRRRRERPRPLGEAPRHPGRPRRPRVPGAGRGAPRTGARAGAPRAGGHPRRRGDLAPGVLPAADRPDVLRLQGRDRPAGRRRQRQAAHELARAAAAGGRDHPRLPRRDRRVAADAHAGRARQERHLHRLPQAAHARGGLPPVPAREGHEPRGRGAPRRQDGGPLAERGAARTGTGARRSRARRRPAAEQRLHLRRRPARLQVPRRLARKTGEPARRARRSTAASTLACTG